ncbi:MAG: hypothetical protein WBV47_10910 [Salegentibacter sp.]
MKFWKKAFDLYINSSFHVGLALVAFTLVTIMEFGLSPDFDLLMFVFFGTITSYNFVKYAGIAKLHHPSLVRNLRLIQIFSFFCFLALVYYSLQQELEILMAAGFFGFLTALYAVPVFKGRTNLRGVKGVKVFVIAITATGVSVVLPLLNHPAIPVHNIIVEFLQRILLIIVLMLPFEIRDLKFDSPDLYTFPQVLGVKKTKIMGYILLVLMFLLEFLKIGVKIPNLGGLLAIGLIAAFFLIKSEEDQGKYYASFWVESAPFFWLGAWFLISVAAS